MHQANEQRRQAGLHRELRVLERADGRTALWQGRELLNFASNNYLGLTSHPRLIEAAQRAARERGTGGGASRLVSGSTAPCQELEAALAAFQGTEAALVFPTGYMAAIGTITALASGGRAILMDKLNHASLIDGGRLAERIAPGAALRVYPHGNSEKLRRLLERTRDRQGGGALIVTDAVFSMDGDLADLGSICALAAEFSATVMIDEAHGTGVFGARGRGAAEHLGLHERVDVHMGTLSKALGGLGGYVASSRALIEHLINTARTFVYTTALPPPVVAAGIAALEVVRSEEGAALREKLRASAQRLRRGLEALGLDTGRSASQIVPVILGENERVLRAAEALLEAGLLVGAIRPPTVPAGSARLRLSVTAAHEPQDIDRLLEGLDVTLRETGRA